MKKLLVTLILIVIAVCLQGFNFKKYYPIVKEVTLQNDFTGAKIKPSDLVNGCPEKDCIPAINAPKFVPADHVEWIATSDVIFVLEYKKTKKIYPQKILNWHEIVNDEVEGIPIVVSFCPLCGTAIAFERIVNGKTTKFGVSGKLHNSDLVMYDKLEGNLWQQLTGEAIVGPAARRNETLTSFPLITTTWGEWRDNLSKSYVLSLTTGHERNYEEYPYDDYETNESIFFPVSHLDKSISPKTPVIGVAYKGYSKAFKVSDLKKNSEIIDSVGGIYIKISRNKNGRVTVVNQASLEKINVYRYFWFAWKTFYPESVLWSPK
jgi:hypothetical protein